MTWFSRCEFWFQRDDEAAHFKLGDERIKKVFDRKNKIDVDEVNIPLTMSKAPSACRVGHVKFTPAPAITHLPQR